jgi:hypothetical protein
MESFIVGLGTVQTLGIGQYCLCMLVALIDIFVIKLFSYDLKDHTFILQTPASTTPFRLYNG